MTFKMLLTDSQKMALTDVVLAYMRLGDDEPQCFVDCSKAHAPETTTAELLELLNSAEMVPVVAEGYVPPTDKELERQKQILRTKFGK